MLKDDTVNKSYTVNDNDAKAKPRKSKVRNLRILIIEPRGRYCRTVWCAIGVGLAHILIGATVMTIVLYFLSKRDIHTILCTFGYHFFAAEAILCLNYANGWSTPLRLRHRHFAHIFLQICGFVCTVTGTVLVYMSKGLSGSIHGVSGLAGGILACMTFVIGPCALKGGRYFKLTHSGFGIPTFLLSSISLCSGLFTSDFKDWTNSTVIFILIGFITFYTMFILVTCFLKCMMRV